MVSASGDHRVQALVHLGLLRSGVLVELPDGLDHARGRLAYIHVPSAAANEKNARSQSILLFFAQTIGFCWLLVRSVKR
jgi:hypothetical protein